MPGNHAMLLGRRSVAAGNPLTTPTLAGTSQSTTAANGTTTTFTGAALGTAAADRNIIALIAMDGVGGTLASATINGVACTFAQRLYNNQANTGSLILLIAPNVASGTTGNIVLTWSATPSASVTTNYAAMVLRCTGVMQVNNAVQGFATGTGNTGPLTSAANALKTGGFGIGTFIRQYTAGTYTGDNITGTPTQTDLGSVKLTSVLHFIHVGVTAINAGADTTFQIAGNAGSVTGGAGGLGTIGIY